MDGWTSIFLNIEMNKVAEEYVVLGRLRPGDSAKRDDVFRDLGLQDCDFRTLPEDYEGDVLDAEGKVWERDVDEYFRRRYYNFAMSCIFDEAPMTEKDFGDDKMFFFCDEMRAYIDGCFPLFLEVLSQDVACDAFSLALPMPVGILRAGKNRMAKFLADVYLQGMRKGQNVTKWFAGALYVPPQVQALVRTQGKKILLACDDVQSVEYKLALLSVVMFLSAENTALYDVKCEKLYARLCGEKNAKNG